MAPLSWHGRAHDRKNVVSDVVSSHKNNSEHERSVIGTKNTGSCDYLNTDLFSLCMCIVAVGKIFWNKCDQASNHSQELYQHRFGILSTRRFWAMMSLPKISESPKVLICDAVVFQKHHKCLLFFSRQICPATTQHTATYCNNNTLQQTAKHVDKTKAVYVLQLQVRGRL